MPEPAHLSAPLQTAYPSCPLCGGASASMGVADCIGQPLWHEPLPRTIEWMRCGACAHVHTRHYWTDAGLAQLFSRAHPFQIAGLNMEPKRLTWKPVVANAVQVLGGYAKLFGAPGAAPVWLDVGCGDGALQMTADEFGFSTVGIDSRAQAAAAVTAMGYRAICGDFLQVRMEQPPIVISMMDVLEHMAWPRKALQHAYEVLAPQGCLVLSMPNMQAGIWRMLDDSAANPYWTEIEHHHNFTRVRLAHLLADHGFEVALFDIPQRYKAQMELYAVRRR
ncbi:MAG: class I SAM-dependent methyltransferase [Burkholderiales bacterium]